MSFALILGLALLAGPVSGAIVAEDGVAEFYAGHASLEKGDATEAIAHFGKALASKSLDDTQKAYVFHYRAVAYQKLERHQEAIDDYTEALALGSLPKRVQAAVYYNRAIGLDRQEKYESAVKDFTSAIALKSDYAEAYMNRGNALRKLGEREQALRDYDASSKYGNPMKHLPYFGRGLVLEEMGDTAAAYEAFKIAASLAPPDFTYASQKVAEYDTGRATGARVAEAADAARGAEGVTAAIRPNTESERPVVAMVSEERTASIESEAPAAAQTSASQPLIDLPESPVADRPVPAAQTAVSAPAMSAGEQREAAPVNTEKAQKTETVRTETAPAATPVSETAAVEPVQTPVPKAPEPAPKKQETAMALPPGYLVQIASYASEASALTESEAIRRRNPEAFTGVEEYIVKADLGSRGTYWRLQYGPFATKDQSEAFCRTLKAKGLACILAPNKG